MGPLQLFFQKSYTMHPRHLVLVVLFLHSFLYCVEYVVSRDPSIVYKLRINSCQPLKLNVCKKLHIYNGTSLPNILGHRTMSDVNLALANYKVAVDMDCSHTLQAFLCVLHAPPCLPGGDNLAPIPCQGWCMDIQRDCGDVFEDLSLKFPMPCRAFPEQYEGEEPHSCVTFTDLKKYKSWSPSVNTATSDQPPLSSTVASSPRGTITEISFGQEEVHSNTIRALHLRRYDVVDLGDSSLFHGWADVQGLGAANDYCRVVGKGKRRFLSCSLAGGQGQQHKYVSQLGFDAGHANTWFMRDLDGDGRDDYCRCVGKADETHISCMKAGERGFHGGIIQGGNQNTFAVPASENCHEKRLNAFFGS